MSEEQGIRLVALIEEQGRGGSNPTFKVTNFFSDIKIVTKWDESGTKHLRDKNGRYQFDIIKTVTTQLPYTKTFKDLTVIVGENGSGKTTLVNHIISEGYQNKRTSLIFQQGEKFWTGNDYNYSIISIPSASFLPNIIKFSNTGEMYKLNNIKPGGIDASYFENLRLEVNKNDAELISLVEITHQIQFVEKFQDDIKEFVDYTQKGIAIDFEVEFPNRYVYHIAEETYGDWDSHSLCKYFWALLHCSFTKESREFELKLHLDSLKNRNRILLDYQFISQYVRFQDYSLGITLNDDNLEFWISLWHRLYVIKLYVDFIMKDGYRVAVDKFKEAIEELIGSLEDDIADYLVSNESPAGMKLDCYGQVIREGLESIGDNPIIRDPLGRIWYDQEGACWMVAHAIRYTFYIKLKKGEWGGHSFVEHTLKFDVIWDKLRIIGTPDEEINQLKYLGELLKNYETDPDFSTVHSIVDIVSQLKTIDVKKYLQLKWWGLSSGELALLKSFSHLFLAKKKLEKNSYRNVDNNSVLLLLDEVDLGLHPEWQRRWVTVALPVIEKIFEGKHLQIIMTTHSPILLSDIYQENVLLLGKGGQEVKGIEKTFGQNIYSLFKDSFFLKKLMGDHAYNRIEETMAFLHHKLGNLRDPLPETNSYHALSEEHQKIWVEKIIASVGEPIIANQLRDLYERAYAEKSEEDRIRAKIRRLQKQLENLRGGDSHDAS